MCDTIYLPKEENDIETVGEFEKRFGVNADEFKGNGYIQPVRRDACLCQIDIEAALDSVGIKYTYEGFGYELRDS